MIWNDDKIKRLMSMGMMHGIEAGAGAAAGGGGFGGGGDVGGLGGGVDSGGFGSDTAAGGLGGAGIGGEGVGSDGQSAFGAFLDEQFEKVSNIDPETAAKLGFGALGFLTAGLPGASIGVKGASALFGGSEKLGEGPPGGRAVDQQSAPGAQAIGPSAASPGSNVGLGGGPGNEGIGGGGGLGQPAQQLAAAGRQSGIAQQPQVNPFLPQHRQFAGGLQPVNLQQFPNALGRV